MIFLLAAVAWILVLLLVAGLCAAARVGDARRLAYDPAAAGWTRSESHARGPLEHLEIAARAGLRPSRSAESGASLTQRDGVAA
jgi:hypothetical protein